MRNVEKGFYHPKRTSLIDKESIHDKSKRKTTWNSKKGNQLGVLLFDLIQAKRNWLKNQINCLDFSWTESIN